MNPFISGLLIGLSVSLMGTVWFYFTWVTKISFAQKRLTSLEGQFEQAHANYVARIKMLSKEYGDE